jgi:threonine dehydratase
MAIINFGGVLESGPAVVGNELKDQNDFSKIVEQLKHKKFNYQYLNENADLFTHLIS